MVSKGLHNSVILVLLIHIGHSVRLGEFERQLLLYETICYSGCDDDCNEGCITTCNSGCNSGCDWSCDYDCDADCSYCVDNCLGSGSECPCLGAANEVCRGSCDGCNNGCDESCDDGCTTNCNENCQSGCDDDCIDYYYRCNQTKDNYVVNWYYNDNSDSNYIGDYRSAIIDEEINADVSIQQYNDNYNNYNGVEVRVIADYKTVAYLSHVYAHNQTNDKDNIPVNYTNGDNDTSFGFTYIIDSHPFDYMNRKYLKDANPCENRFSASFDNVSFSNYWNFSYYPSNPNQLGNDKYLEYPNSIYNLTMVQSNNDPCGKIQWSYMFTLNELINNCSVFVNNRGNSNNNYNYQIATQFYITALSPNIFHEDYNEQFDSGHYLLQTLNLTNYSVNIINSKYWNSININITHFSSNIISINCDLTCSQIKLTLLSSVINWMKLGDSEAGKVLLQPSISKLNEINTVLGTNGVAIVKSINVYPIPRINNCFVNDNNRCWQKWVCQHFCLIIILNHLINIK